MERTFIVVTVGGALGGTDTQSLSLALRWYFAYVGSSTLFLQLEGGHLQELKVPEELKTIEELTTYAQARVPSPELTDEQKYEIILGLRKLI